MKTDHYAELLYSSRVKRRDLSAQHALINLIEPIIVYKFPRKTRDEVQTMLGIVKEDLRQTQFYQDVYQEGKLETVPLLLQLGLTLEQMADRLQLPLADVIHAAGS